MMTIMTMAGRIATVIENDFDGVLTALYARAMIRPQRNAAAVQIAISAAVSCADVSIVPNISVSPFVL